MFSMSCISLHWSCFFVSNTYCIIFLLWCRGYAQCFFFNFDVCPGNAIWKGPKYIFKNRLHAASPFCGLVTESWRRSMRLTMLECTGIETALSCGYGTAWKTSAFQVILVHIFPHSDWIRREILRTCPYSVQMRENTDQNNSEYRRF